MMVIYLVADVGMFSDPGTSRILSWIDEGGAYKACVTIAQVHSSWSFHNETALLLVIQCLVEFQYGKEIGLGFRKDERIK